jgi:aryl-alcohol dehydrogenase-like predicted oxidoreductase
MAFLTRPLSSIGFGAFKIGRNAGVKYERGYDLPDMPAVRTLLNGILDMGINYVDTAPAYGLSERRIGETIAHRRHEYTLSTKVGESFSNGVSRHDFSKMAVQASIDNSLRSLRTDVLDCVFIHSTPDDVWVLEQTDVVPTLIELRQKGLIRGIGLSGYTVEGFRKALPWVDAIMAEYHPKATSLTPIIQEAASRGILLIVKKGLGSGTLDAADSLTWILRNPAVTSVIVGSLSLDHMRENLRIALGIRQQASGISGMI